MPVAGELYTPRLVLDGSGPDSAVTALDLQDPADDVVALTPPAAADTGEPGSFTAAALRLASPGEWRLLWHTTTAGVARTVVQVVDVDPDPGAAPTGFSYATTGDLVAYTGQPLPGGARRALINASREIQRCTRAARYAVDVDGHALDPRIRRDLAEATCELTQWWAETGNDSGASALITNASIAGVSVGYGGRTTGNAQADRVGPRVWTMLLNANLVQAGSVLHG
jgi:hypothetical protein